MADNSNGGGSAAPFLAFLVGGLIVAVVVLGFFMYNGHTGSSSVNVPSHLSLNVKTPVSHP
ncbi:MAG: hypothetical protein JOZ55_11885 [Alphaproteobacteria bacterium]|nr:hypothetical protein [Alphaproteobacteria bacterium]